MALTNTFPTGLPTGLSIADTRRIIAGLIVRDTTGAPRLGVIPRHFIPIVTSTSSMAYAVGAFEAVVSRTGVGVELVVNDGTTNVPTTAAPAANSRIDVVWVRARFSASGDTADAPEFGVTQGTASSSPVKPTLPLGALELATATVPSAATSTNSPGVVINQTHLYTAAAGGTVAVRTPAELLAFAAQDGQSAYVVSGGYGAARTGGQWLPDGPIATTFTSAITLASGAVVTHSLTPALSASASSSWASSIVTPTASGFAFPKGGLIQYGLTIRSEISGVPTALGSRVCVDVKSTMLDGTASMHRLSWNAGGQEDILTGTTPALAAAPGASIQLVLFHNTGRTLTFVMRHFITRFGPAN
ncbi:hypothetical protein [Plantibacter sp. YIM 135249]|uniref:hypothetical protein n=1 Tax=Plantibacter sp. YIM 135249 TaxID=3423918 RepID=UPI003D333C03